MKRLFQTGLEVSLAVLLAACGTVDENKTSAQSSSLKPAINVYQVTGSVSESTTETSSEISSDNSYPAEKEERSDIALADILIIVRENGHGWNDNDNGKFITSDGKLFEFDATELEPENKSARFIEYENLYPILLDIAKTENPLAQVKVDELSKDILDFKADQNDRTSESVGFDIGKVDYQIVRELNGELVFESIYSNGDSICGYTKNEIAMKIVDEVNRIIHY